MTIPVNFFECFETLQEIKSDGNCISHSVNNSVHIICSYLEKKVKTNNTIKTGMLFISWRGGDKCGSLGGCEWVVSSKRVGIAQDGGAWFFGLGMVDILSVDGCMFFTVGLWWWDCWTWWWLNWDKKGATAEEEDKQWLDFMILGVWALSVRKGERAATSLNYYFFMTKIWVDRVLFSCFLLEAITGREAVVSVMKMVVLKEGFKGWCLLFSIFYIHETEAPSGFFVPPLLFPPSSLLLQAFEAHQRLGLWE